MNTAASPYSASLFAREGSAIWPLHFGQVSINSIKPLGRIDTSLPQNMPYRWQVRREDCIRRLSKLKLAEKDINIYYVIYHLYVIKLMPHFVLSSPTIVGFNFPKKRTCQTVFPPPLLQMPNEKICITFLKQNCLTVLLMNLFSN